MDKYKKVIHNNQPAIRFYDNHAYCQRFLCRNDLFKPYLQPKWEWDMHPNLNINGENVNIVFESAVETYILFESEDLQKQIYDWIQNNDLGAPDYWKKLAGPILNKLKSDNILLIKEGLSDLKQWVDNYNKEYVDDSKDSVDLTIFEYDFDNWEEGDLWSNSLFDRLLEKHKDKLNEVDLLNLIGALFNKNEEYADCKATYIAMNYLLEKRTHTIEFSIVEATLHALNGHEPGHRFFERSLLDRLVDDIFPTFSVDSILKLLEGSHPDNIRGEHYGGHGDNFISLAHIAMNNKPNEQQRKRLTELIKRFEN